MAQVDGTVSGLVVDTTLATREDFAEDVSPIGQKLLDAFRANERGQYKAAAAYACDAVNMMAADHGVMCGASL